MGIIYKITNRKNNKIYIGQSRQPARRRWNQHVCSAQNTIRNDSHLPIHLAMRKYGIDSFAYEVIECCEDSILNDREIYWISFFNSTDMEKGYNLSHGGDGASYYQMEEILALWDEGNSIKEISEITGHDRGYLSLKLKDIGISEKEILDRRYAMSKKSNSFLVYQYSLSGQYLATYQSVQEARRITQIGHIEKCCNGIQKQAGGYVWSYEKHDSVPPVIIDHPASKKKAVYQYDLKGNKIAEHESAYHANKKTGIAPTAIQKVCLGRSYTAGGDVWSFENKPHITVELTSNTGKAKRVAKCDINTGEIIEIYNSLAQAAKDNNISSVGNISSACTGKYKSCAGFIWKYVEV